MELRQDWPGGRYFPDWYLFIRFPNRKPESFCTGYEICPKCLADERPAANREGCACQVKPRRIGRERIKALNDERWGLDGKAAAVPLARRSCATVGEVIEAYLGWYCQLGDAGKLRNARRACGDLRLVVATALGLMTRDAVLRGVKTGSLVADAAKVDALPVTALTKEVVREYFRRRQGGTFDPISRRAENVSINKTLNHARTVFSRNARAYALEACRIPWESLADFLSHPLLKSPVRGVELVDSVAWDAMAEEADAMMEAGRAERTREYWVGMTNRILRRTGLRSVELVAAHVGWLVDLAGKTWIDVRDREDFAIKGGTTPGMVPISAELAKELRENGGYFIGPPDREAIVRGEHNKFCKSHLGGLGTRGQGNHRLRDFVAQYLYTLYGETVAKEALRHADARTTMQSYARYRSDVPLAAAAELEAWRPRQATADGEDRLIGRLWCSALACMPAS